MTQSPHNVFSSKNSLFAAFFLLLCSRVYSYPWDYELAPCTHIDVDNRTPWGIMLNTLPEGVQCGTTACEESLLVYAGDVQHFDVTRLDVTRDKFHFSFQAYTTPDSWVIDSSSDIASGKFNMRLDGGQDICDYTTRGHVRFLADTGPINFCPTEESTQLCSVSIFNDEAKFQQAFNERFPPYPTLNSLADITWNMFIKLMGWCPAIKAYNSIPQEGERVGYEKIYNSHSHTAFYQPPTISNGNVTNEEQLIFDL
jgi:hypothetical protein